MAAKYLSPFFALILFAAEPAWQSKPIASWTADDAQQVLNDSPWAKTATPKIVKTTNTNQSRSNASIAQLGGVNIGLPGMGGMGRHANRNSQTSESGDNSNATPTSTPTLTIRWESSLPVQAAELKAKNVNSPTMDDEHYAVAVYGIPNRLIKEDTPALDTQLKDQAAIKREGQKDFKPSRVEVIPRDQDTVVVYYFSRSKEITRNDKQFEFAAQIVNLQVSVFFNVEDMTFQNKLEL